MNFLNQINKILIAKKEIIYRLVRNESKKILKKLSILKIKNKKMTFIPLCKYLFFYHEIITVTALFSVCFWIKILKRITKFLRLRKIELECYTCDI